MSNKMNFSIDSFTGRVPDSTDEKAKEELYELARVNPLLPAPLSARKLKGYYSNLRKMKTLFDKLSYVDRLLFWGEQVGDKMKETIVINDEISARSEGDRDKYFHRFHCISIRPEIASEGRAFYNYLKPYFDSLTSAKDDPITLMPIEQFTVKYNEYVQANPNTVKAHTHHLLNYFTDTYQRYVRIRLDHHWSYTDSIHPILDGYECIINGRTSSFPLLKDSDMYSSWYRQFHLGTCLANILAVLEVKSSELEVKNNKRKVRKGAVSKAINIDSFDSLFHDQKMIEPCLSVLRELEQPLLDSDNRFIGKDKGAICVWIDEMTMQGIMKKLTDRDLYAKLISQRIGISISGSLFAKHGKRAEKEYRLEMKTRLSEKKLSQV